MTPLERREALIRKFKEQRKNNKKEFLELPFKVEMTDTLREWLVVNGYYVGDDDEELL